MKSLLKTWILGSSLIFFLNPITAQINDGGSLPRSFEQPTLFKRLPPTISIPALDMVKVNAEDEIKDQSNYKAPRFGVLIPVDIGLDEGTWSSLNNGDRVWRIEIRARGAKATNFYFDEFYMPQGATMHIYSRDRSEMIGGFGAHNNQPHGMFSTALIHGESAIIEYYEPDAVKGQGRIHISDVNHAYRMVEKPNRSIQKDFGDSNPCQINVNCSPEGDGKTQQRDAVARILVRAGQGAGWCTGTMINNVRQDCKPYFLTALHCADDNNGNIIPQTDFNQWIFYFNYQAAGCPNPASEGLVPNNTITGADVRADSQDPTIATGSDLLLLEFQNAVPNNYNVYFAGWNRSATATTGGFGIHHPAGDIKKISTFTGTAVSSGWNQAGVTHWSLSWVATTNGHGVTEGGSSGSGLFDNNGRLIGSLSGGSSFCEAPNDSDSYGKMSYHWDQNGMIAARRLKDWLDPDDTGAMTLDGTYFPCQTATNLDAGISAITYPTNGSTFCENPFSPQVTLENFGATTLTSVTINYKIDNGVVNTFNWNQTLVQNATTTVTLPGINAPVGNAFSLMVYTSNPNGGTDEQPGNDGTTIMTQLDQGLGLPYVQNFSTGIPNEIEIIDDGGDNAIWMHNNTVNGFGTGTGIGSMAFDNFNNDVAGTMDRARLPMLNLTGSQNTKLQFDVAYAQYDNEFSDTLIVQVSNDCRTSYQMIFKKGGDDLATAPDKSDDVFVPGNTEWRTEMVDLAAYDGNSGITIEFVNLSGYGQQVFVDNIQVSSTTVAGNYQVLPSMATYGTLQEAINNANPGNTIKLINNATEAAPVELPAGYIFDFPASLIWTVSLIP